MSRRRKRQGMGHGYFWGDDDVWDKENGKTAAPPQRDYCYDHDTKKGNSVAVVPLKPQTTADHGAKTYTPAPTVYNAGYTYNTGTPYQKKCPGHDGLTIVHAYPNGATLCGASRYDLMKHGVDLLIDCGVDVTNAGFVKSAPVGFEDLKAYGFVPNVLKLDWPDRSAPAVGWEFWRSLREKFQKDWNIVACCIGGHGRTGTCLSALLIEDGMSATEAIDQVRTIHCTYAVESPAQEVYLEWLASTMPPRKEDKS